MSALIIVPSPGGDTTILMPGGPPGPPGPQGNPGVGSTIGVKDESTLLGTGFSTLKFAGAGVTATASGSEATVTIPGGGTTTLQVRTPFDHGAVGDGTTDDSAALNAFFSYCAANRVEGHCTGNFAVSSALTLDGGTYGDDLTFAINFGRCRITALSAISRLLTIKDCYRANFSGSLHLRGTGYTSDANTAWTCDTGLYIDRVSHCSMPDNLRLVGFGYAGVEFAPQPADANTIKWGHVNGGRIGSGALTTTMCRTANWTWNGNQTMGAGTEGSQYSQITVDALPSTYAAAVTGTTPLRQVNVEINGRLHRVTYISGTTLRIFPALRSSYSGTGTLVYHYGALVRIIGNDSNIGEFGIISGVGVSTPLEIGSLYGHKISMLHAQNAGAAYRAGASADSTLYGNLIDYLYCEGNRFNQVWMSPTLLDGFQIGTRGADVDANKDFTLVALASADAYSAATTTSGVTVGASTGGFHYSRKNYRGGVSSSIAVNMGEPRVIDGLKIVTESGSDGITLNLTAADPDLAAQYGYDQTYVLVHGRGTGGKPAGGITVHTTNGAHTINGAGAGVDLSIAAVDLAGPALLAIWQKTATTWDVRLVAGGAVSGGGIPAGDATFTGALLSSTSVGSGALSGNGMKVSYNSSTGLTLQGKTGGFYCMTAFNASGSAIFQVNDTAQSIAYFDWALYPTGKGIKVNGNQVVSDRQTGTAATATDLATAITLVNDLRTKLIAHGLIS